MQYLYIFALVLLISCTEPTEPPPPPDTGPDTTSHDFSWTIDTIGTNGSMLMDVAVINENDIWAVGEIYKEGETDPYNAVHWNGSNWILQRIPAVTYWGSISKGPILSVFAFSANDVWMFSKAGSYAHWNGSTWDSEIVYETNGSIYKIWGTSSKNMYFIGSNGNITHYNGQSWKRLDSGTDIHFRDIWGDYNEENESYEILAVASNDPQSPQAMKLVKINNNQVSSLPNENLPLSLRSIWFKSALHYYLVGDGVFHSSRLDSNWQHDASHPLLYKESVRGNDTNDVFIVGSFGLVSHYNGSSWKQYKGYELPEFYGTYGKMYFKNNFITTVGWINDSAVILRGKRN